MGVSEELQQQTEANSVVWKESAEAWLPFPSEPPQEPVSSSSYLFLVYLARISFPPNAKCFAQLQSRDECLAGAGLWRDCKDTSEF